MTSHVQFQRISSSCSVTTPRKCNCLPSSPSNNHFITSKMDLSSYQVSPKTGFLPETPPRRLRGPQLERWEETARRIPELIKSGQLASAVDELPSFPLNELEDEGDWRRAYSVLGFLANAYLWGSAPQPTEVIPPCLPGVAGCQTSGWPAESQH